MSSQDTAIAYPQRSFGMTASLEDIADTTIWDSVILGRELFRAHNAFAADELFNLLRRLDGLKIHGMNGLEHSLKAATLAWNDLSKQPVKSRREWNAARQQWTVAALFLNIGTVVVPDNAVAFSAELLKPYLSETIYLTMKNYESFQSSPQQYLTQPWFTDAERFSGWQRDAVSTAIPPFTLEQISAHVKDFFKVSLLFKRIPDARIIPE